MCQQAGSYYNMCTAYHTVRIYIQPQPLLAILTAHNIHTHSVYHTHLHVHTRRRRETVGCKLALHNVFDNDDDR